MQDVSLQFLSLLFIPSYYIIQSLPSIQSIIINKCTVSKLEYSIFISTLAAAPFLLLNIIEFVCITPESE